MKKREKRSLAILCSVAVLLLACVVTFSALVWAKYVSQEKKDTVVAAKSFYFESDLLTETGTTYTLAPGTGSITVHLKNFADDLRFSDVEISYKVTATGQAAQTGTLGKSKQEDHTIVFSNLSPGTYQVVAQATSPYTKTLQATFVIPAVEGDVYYSVSDAAGSPVLRLTVWTEDYSGGINIKWGNGNGNNVKIVPDNTDPLMAGVTGNSFTVSDFGNDAEYTFLFFKEDPSKQYDKSDFTVTAAQ